MSTRITEKAASMSINICPPALGHLAKSPGKRNEGATEWRTESPKGAG